MPSYIVADIGGTQIRVALFPADSQVPKQVKRTSTQGENIPALERIFRLIESIWPQDDQVLGIALAAPGPTDAREGIVFNAPNIPAWKNLPLRKHLQDRFKVPAAIGNDANLAAMGEWKFGAGRGHHHLVYITVSTGIGSGVIVEDQLLLGVRGLAAELGHITVMPEGPLCGCGQRGHLEAIASGPAIARWVEEEISQGVPTSMPTGRALTAKDISLAARQGDELAIAALARAGTYLGIAVTNCLHIFNPSIVIIGGGVTQSGEFLLGPMRTAIHEYIFSPQYLENLVLTTAALGDEVGLMGALALAHTIKNP